MRLPPRPVRAPVALIAFILALVAPAPALALDQQVPLELRPSQGPAGSSTIVHAAGLEPDEDVRVRVDGAAAATLTADVTGAAAGVVEMPAAVGVHRIALTGVSSHRTAAGTFRTTAAGAARTAFLASPRPMGDSGDSSFPNAVRYLVANFPASQDIEGYYYWEPDNTYYVFDMGTADAEGTLDRTDTWGNTGYGVISLAIGKPGATEPLLAADALIVGTEDYTPERRVRPVPALADTNQPVFLVGSGFKPGGATTLSELTGPATTSEDPVGDAAADGTVVARDDDGDLDQEFKLVQNGGYGATAVFREFTSTTPPTAAAALDVLDPGTATRFVAVGLAPGAVTLTGRDAAGTTTTANRTVEADGTLVASFTVPAGAAPGPYEIEGGGASATLAVRSAGRLAEGPGTVALPVGGGDVTRDATVCNDRATASTVSVSENSTHVTVPASLNVPADSCVPLPVTVDDDGATGQSSVTLTITTGGFSDTVTFERDLRDVSIDPVTTRTMDAAEPPHTPLHLSGNALPTTQVRVFALPYGDPPFELGTPTADGSGEWELDVAGLPHRGSHLRFAAVPLDISTDVDLSAFAAEGVRYASRFFHTEGANEWTDLTTSTTVFRDVGEVETGIGDVWVADPETSTDTFDGAAALEVETTGGASVPVTATDEGGGKFDDDLVVERQYIVGDPGGVTLERRHDVAGGSRTMVITDAFTNPTGTPQTFAVSLVTVDGRDIDDQELRLSTGTEWLGDGDIPASGTTLAEGGAVPAEGYVALRDEDAADASTSGHGFVGWEQDPDRVLTRPDRRDIVVLEYTVTVPANGTAELRHALGATATDATALAAAAAAVDDTAPTVAITSPASGAPVATRDISVTGTTSDALATPTVDVNGVAATVASDGTWSAQVTLPDGDGVKTITAIADDGHGQTAQAQRDVTLTRPPIVTTGDATAIARDGADIPVTVDPNGNATKYSVEYGEVDETPAFDSETAESAEVTTLTNATVSLSGLTPDTEYQYRVTATSAAGTTDGATKTFTTLPPANAPVPGTLTASELGRRSVQLDGTLTVNDPDTTWWVEYGLGESFDQHTTHLDIGDGEQPVSVDLSVLEPGTTYKARLAAVADSGAVQRGSAVEFTTVALPAPGALTATVTHDTAALSGTAGGDASDVTWKVRYGETTAYGSELEVEPNGTAVQAGLGGLNPSTTYHARLVATAGSETVEGPDLEFTTTAAPTPPGDGGGGGGDGGGTEPPPPGPGPIPCGRQVAAGCGAPLGPPIPFATLPADLRPKTIALKGLGLGFDLTRAKCPCTLVIDLLMDRKLARKLKAAAAPRLVSVGKVTRSYPKPGPARALVKLKPKARKAIRKVKRVVLVLNTKLTDADGRTTTAQRRITLKR